MVAHAARVVLEVAPGGRELVFPDAFQGVGAGGGGDAVDVPVVQVLQPACSPGRRREPGSARALDGRVAGPDPESLRRPR